MRRILIALVVTLALAGGGAFIGGCVAAALSPEQEARVETLVDKNVELAKKLDNLRKDAKDGKLDAAAVVSAMDAVQDQMKANKEEISKIHADAVAAGATAGGVAGALGRTALHGIGYAAGKWIPGPIGLGIQLLTGLLLGGSAGTEKKRAIAATTPPS